MPRIRSIKPEFWGDEKLGPMDPVHRLTFLGLISMADDMGRVLDNAKQIDAFVFPYTRHTTSAALTALEALGRIVRGETRQGQRVIQVRNWHHQRIDKPNVASSLPPIGGVEDETTAYRARKKIAQWMTDEIWTRDKATCQECGLTPLRRRKRDRYDAGADLGEVDHIVEAADGGEATLDNLHLLCKSCNRKKGGVSARRRNAAKKEIDARRIADDSANDSANDSQNVLGIIEDVSAPRSTTGDRRPETGDRPTAPRRKKRDTSASAPGWATDVAEAWTREIGGIKDRTVATDLSALFPLYGLSALLAAVGNFAKHRRLAVQSGAKFIPRWPQFVADLRDYIPGNLLPQVPDGVDVEVSA